MNMRRKKLTRHNMSNQELQEEEKDVLSSIYDSDECFKQSSGTTFTYRVGEAGESKSFLVEITWGELYPDEVPAISLDAFFNKHLNEESKRIIMKTLTEEAAGLTGTPMTYSLFEFAKEKADEMIVSSPPDAAPSRPKVKKEKKQILTKQQKRRLAERCNAHGERPRGWNWVDVVKLSKTGSNSSL